ncbi:MAG: M3 family metallopeptidase [Ignavibacteriae bacterium]|nr:M3 family metallopeptidase [Ignavibacteriota bacterium]
MKKNLIILFALIMIQTISYSQNNPLLKEYDTPFKVPPFEQIKNEHFLPALREGIKQQSEIIEAIVNNPESPTYKNTIEAYEFSDNLLTEVRGVFFNLSSANTNPELQKIASEIAPELSAHSDNILLNEKFFSRIKEVYRQRATLTNPEQVRLLDKTYNDFVRGGANLDDTKKSRLREINKDLSLLRLKFGENLLAETNGFKLIIEDKNDLSGLPESVISGAYETGKKSGMEGKWIFTLQNPSLIPFLQYSDKRELREKIWRAYSNRCNNNNEFDNKEIIVKIVNLKLERAKLLGFNTTANFILDENMAKNPENVFDFLSKLWKPSLEAAKREAEELQKLIEKEGGSFKLQPWDWRYYSEKMRKEKYALDEEMLKPYFELNKVKEGIFYLSNKLYGLNFKKLDNMPVYNEEVQVYEITESDGTHVGIYYMDLHPRAGKRGGAWSSSFRSHYKTIDGKDVPPVITNVCNFSRPAGDLPALLTFDEVETFFHEFGHALNSLLSKCGYRTVAGVPRDFVELPSQILENWLDEPEMLEVYAKHYKTGEVIPKELIEKLDKSSKYGQGFTTVEYLAASILDMEYHTLKEDLKITPNEFENKILEEKYGLIPEIISRYKSTYFNHIFNSGYTAGYYSYIWAEVLDADAYELFRQKGIFDKATAESFRKNILEKGGIEDPMVLYKKFRGAEPSIEPLLKKRGLK